MDMPRDQRGFMYTDKVIRDGEPSAYRRRVATATTSAKCCRFARSMSSVANREGKWSSWGNPGGPQKEIRAKVAPAPYKTDNRKLDVHSLPQFSPTA